MRTLRLVLVGVFAVLASCGNGSSKDYKVGDTGPGGGIIVYVDKAGFGNSSGDDTSLGAVCLIETCNFLEMAPKDLDGKLLWQEAMDAAEGFSTPSADDWVLPSKNAINVMYLVAKSDVSLFSSFFGEVYWSSSVRAGSTISWYQNFDDGNQYYGGQDFPGYVRPVRAF